MAALIYVPVDQEIVISMQSHQIKKSLNNKENSHQSGEIAYRVEDILLVTLPTED